MVSLITGVAEGLRRVACGVLAAQDYVNGSLGNIYPPGSVLPGIAIRALRRINGCDPTDDPELPQPPVVGGQCPVFYFFDYQQRQVDANGVGSWGSTIFQALPGPLIFGKADPEANEDCGDTGLVFTNARVSSGTAANTIVLSLGCADVGPGWRIIRLERTDGLPDDCGDPPAPFPPPSPINIDVDVTYNIDDGTEVDVTIPFIFAPIVTDINGSFYAPFTFEFGGIEFSGNVELSPNFNVTINPPAAPIGTDSPLTDLPGPEDEVPVEPPPPGEVVVGVVVQSRLIGEQQLTTILTSDIPQILVPRCGSVKFGYRIGGRSFWSPDIDIKDLNCFIPCPFSQGAATVAASPAPGVVLNYVPIFGSPLATLEDVSSTPAP